MLIFDKCFFDKFYVNFVDFLIGSFNIIEITELVSLKAATVNILNDNNPFFLSNLICNDIFNLVGIDFSISLITNI